LAAKRQLIANNFYYHAHLGTAATAEQIVTSIYGTALLQEWPIYGGLPNHFRILLDTTIAPALQAQIVSTLTVVKRASQAMDGFFLYTTVSNSYYVAVGVYMQAWIFLPLPTNRPWITYFTLHASIVAKATVQRASAVLRLVVSGGIIATVRQVVAGAMVADIKMQGSVTTATALRTLKNALVVINAGGRITSSR
jgi:hypothetical protein